MELLTRYVDLRNQTLILWKRDKNEQEQLMIMITWGNNGEGQTTYMVQFSHVLRNAEDVSVYGMTGVLRLERENNTSKEYLKSLLDEMNKRPLAIHIREPFLDVTKKDIGDWISRLEKGEPERLTSRDNM